MSKVKSFMYYIEYNDGEDDTMDEITLGSEVDANFDKISKIVKHYRLHDDPKTKIRMTLYTTDHTFSAEEYIEHYRSMPRDIYGADFLSDFDIELITMFN
jgi:hypothetical protein